MRTVAEALDQQIEWRREKILRLRDEIFTLGQIGRGLGSLANELQARKICDYVDTDGEPLHVSMWLYELTPESHHTLLCAPRDQETVTLIVLGEDGEEFSEDSVEAYLVIHIKESRKE